MSTFVGFRLRTILYPAVLLLVACVQATPTSATAPVLSGDYNRDGVVNAQDAAVWAALLGSFDPQADGDFNGVVDAADYIIVFANLANALDGSMPDPTPADLIYHSSTGNVSLDQTKANGGLINAFVLNGGGFNAPGVASFPFLTPVVSVVTEVDTPSQIGQIDVTLVGLPTTQFSLGPILPTSLTLPQLQSTLSGSFYLGAFGGSSGFNFIVVPEPSVFAPLLSGIALIFVPRNARRRQGNR